MSTSRRQPGLHPALRGHVASLAAYDVDVGAPGVHRGLPSTTVTLVVPAGEPLDVAWADGRARSVGWSVVSGLHAGPALIRHGGRQRGLQVELTLGGARALLGLPPAVVAGQLVGLEELGVPGLADLPARLAETDEPHRWHELVQDALVRRLARHGTTRARAEVRHALDRLGAGAGVEETAAAVGFSRRHLAGLVRAECGIAPKQVQRIGRLQRTRAALRPGVALADLAARLGYADQSHLTREWVALAGCTPTTWLAEEFPFVQDLPPEPEAG